MTIKDLAAKTGYAVGTVSRALNDHPNVSAKARKAILQAAKESGFQLNVNAKQLKQSHTNNILVIVKGTGNEFFSEMLEYIQTLISKTRYQLVVDYLDEDLNDYSQGKYAEIQALLAKKLDEIRGTVDEKLQDTLQKKITDSFQTVSQQLEQVYKGLGEMDPEEMAETVMSADTRILKQITMEDAAQVASVFMNLMGESVTPRKKFIEDNAERANIDV